MGICSFFMRCFSLSPNKKLGKTIFGKKHPKVFSSLFIDKGRFLTAQRSVRTKRPTHHPLIDLSRIRVFCDQIPENAPIFLDSSLKAPLPLSFNSVPENTSQ